MIYQLDIAGSHEGRVAYDVRTPKGTFAGVISDQKGGYVRVYFNSTATKGSKRKFADRSEALEFIHARRVKKGWAAA
jgi:hypothetical protein